MVSQLCRKAWALSVILLTACCSTAGHVITRSDDVNALEIVQAQHASEIETLKTEMAAMKAKIAAFETQTGALYTRTNPTLLPTTCANDEFQVCTGNMTENHLISVSVAFTAYTSAGNIPASPGGVIRFEHTLENTGNAYDPNSGVFTAPFDGLYMFLVSVDVDHPYSILRLEKNGHVMVYGNDDNGREHITTGGVFRLQSGDTVAMVHESSAGIIDGGHESVFFGYRLH
ncbi:hypothetical protein BaRGS_00001994 [Batillaria attramentaria]|uniref:C1q domain-containing protein n=1 Tax=Batillaria attramentaria TaxID=370345 RepID=A0ABD0M3V8_9CAEN